MPFIVSAGAQTQHPCGQIKPEPDRNGCVALYFLIYSTVSVTTQVKRVNAYRDMNSRRHDRGLRWLVRLLRLVGRFTRWTTTDWKDTHGARFLCDCGLLSAARSIFTDLVALYISFML